MREPPPAGRTPRLEAAVACSAHRAMGRLDAAAAMEGSAEIPSRHRRISLPLPTQRRRWRSSEGRRCSSLVEEQRRAALWVALGTGVLGAGRPVAAVLPQPCPYSSLSAVFYTRSRNLVNGHEVHVDVGLYIDLGCLPCRPPLSRSVRFCV